MRFDPNNGSKPTQSTVKTGSLAAPPEQNPQRDGFRFNGWTCNGQPYDFQTPILQDITLTAKWAKTTDWTLSPNHGPATGAQLTISPHDRQEPYYTSIQAAGNQFIGLTGDGRIYTWTQDSTPVQVPLPAQAPDGFHYLQAATSSQSQAALGSDQHIYTWTSQQATPTILDTSRNTRFTSISLNDDRLLAVDQQGQVHTFQASQPGTQDPTAKPGEQTTAGLPGQAQAITALAFGSRIFIVDADGQAWIWDANNTGKAKLVRVRQNPGVRFVQAQALSKGILLLDANGQAYHIADSTTNPTALSLPDGAKASSISSSKDQTIITSTDGHVWAWKPGETPKRADDGNQQYMQTAEVGSMITSISKQGDIYEWSLDEQGKPGKPTRLDTDTAPTLESANMDGQPLKLTRKNDVWQADAPFHRPGPAAITLTGRQDGQPFTRSLRYMVDQTLTRGTEPNTTHTVHFNTDKGDPTPSNQNVSYPYGRVQRPSPDPVRQGYLFDGWFTGEVAYDFSKPVTKDLTLSAKWTLKQQNNQWSINPDKGSQLGGQQTIITPPDTSRSIKFNQVSGSKDNTYAFSLSVGSDGNIYAWGFNRDGELGDATNTDRYTPVIVKKPDRATYPDVPADFTYVQVSAGGEHTLALGSDGYVYAWGSNSDGQLGNRSIYSSKVPVRVRDPRNPTDKNKGLKAIQVSAGDYHSLAVGSDGYVYAWGSNSDGQLGNKTTRSSSFPVQVRDPASPADTSKGLQATQVSSGWSHSLAVGSDGYAYAWGSNDHDQLGNSSVYSSSVPVQVRDPNSPTDTNKGLQATQVSSGYLHSLAIGNNGYAYAWGWNKYGQLGNGTTKDSAVPVQVRDPANPTDTNKGLQATQVSSGWSHSLAVGSDKYAYAWGWNLDGELGNHGGGYDGNSSVPVHVRDPGNPNDASKGLQTAQVSGGSAHSLAVGSDGYAYAWGHSSYGQLGDGDTGRGGLSIPVLVAFNLQPVINGVKFDQTTVSGLTRGKGNSVSVTTPPHLPGTVTVSVDYTMGGIGSKLTDKSLRYMYMPLGVLPKAGGEGILLALATGMTGMGGVLASRRHRREQHRLSHASHE